MPRRRIFIAIQIPEGVKNSAEFYLKPFFGDKNIRIPKKEGWHITLVFCGYLDDEEIEALKEIVKKVASEFKAFELSPQKILFAPPNRPRMIWLTFKPSPQFGDLKNKIESAIISYQTKELFKNFHQETRESNPHLTLARFEEKSFNDIKNFLIRDGIDLTKETAPFLAKSIDIMESYLSRSGADYKIVSSLSLNRNVQAHSFCRN